MKTQHTPTPWQQSETSVFTGGGTIAKTFQPGNLPLEEANANAAFICKAVNNHAALVEALTTCISWLDSESNGAPESARTALTNATANQ